MRSEQHRVAVSLDEESVLQSLAGVWIDVLDCDGIAAGLHYGDGAVRISAEEEFLAIPDHPLAHISRVRVDRLKATDAAQREQRFRAQPGEQDKYVRRDLGQVSGVSVLQTAVQFAPLVHHAEYRLLDVTLQNVFEQDFAFAHPDSVPEWSPDLALVEIGIEITTSLGHTIWAVSGSGSTVKEITDAFLVSNFPTGAHFVTGAIDEERPEALMRLTRCRAVDPAPTRSP